MAPFILDSTPETPVCTLGDASSITSLIIPAVDMDSLEIGSHLSGEERAELASLLDKHSDCFANGLAYRRRRWRCIKLTQATVDPSVIHPIVYLILSDFSFKTM